MRNGILIIFIFISFIGNIFVNAQQEASPSVVLPHAEDSVVVDNPVADHDSLALADTVPSRKGMLEAPVTYASLDSIVLTAGNLAYLYGKGKVSYQMIELESEFIEMNMDSSLVYATYAVDSLGEEFGYPLFKEGEQEYESKTMRYNFNTKKGYITSVITEQGEGYVTAERTKKMEDNALNMVNGKYTTCDHHEQPHFYIQLTKAKVRPHKDIVTGPVYLVIEDVPLPLALPFCFFPFSSTYQSGIIMPTYGDESRRGFHLRDGGYYFAISDYLDLALTGEIYTKGSWGLSARTNYRKRYKYQGNFQASYRVTKDGEKLVPSTYGLSKDFSVVWTHSQDAKANPFRTFSASVNFSTSSYDRNNTNGYISGNATNSNRGSTVSMTQRFPNSPFSLSGTFSINQRLRDSSLAVTLPDITLTMSRIYPFKRKNAVGKERWYEKISMSYTGYLRNKIDTKENLIMKSSIVKDWKNSMEHSIPISATYNLFNYINFTPSISYKEAWYTNKISKAYDPDLQRLAPTDTTYGFYRLYEYSASASASTTVYGDFIPLPFLQKLTKIKQIRHRVEPTIGISYRPDFGAPMYGFYKTYRYIDGNGKEKEEQYSPFEHHSFRPSKGRSGSINMGLSNNLEMKVFSDRDSTGERKISLIENLSFNTAYNMAADSFQWNNLDTRLRIRFSKSYTLNLSGTFDVYENEGIYDSNGNLTGLRPKNKLRAFSGRGIGRLRSTGTSFSYTFSNETFKKWFGGDKDKGSKNSSTEDEMLSEDEWGDMYADDHDHMTDMDNHSESTEGGRMMGEKKEVGSYDNDGYLVTQIPWSLSFNYGMRLAYDTQKIDPVKLDYKYKIEHTLSFSGSIQPTKNWRVNFSATYDMEKNKISYATLNISRNMHCFQMSASIVPVGPYKSYSFSIAASSSLLKDLKYQQSSNAYDAQKWY